MGALCPMCTYLRQGPFKDLVDLDRAAGWHAPQALRLPGRGDGHNKFADVAGHHSPHVVHQPCILRKRWLRGHRPKIHCATHNAVITKNAIVVIPACHAMHCAESSQHITRQALSAELESLPIAKTCQFWIWNLATYAPTSPQQ